MPGRSPGTKQYSSTNTNMKYQIRFTGVIEIEAESEDHALEILCDNSGSINTVCKNEIINSIERIDFE